MLHLLSVSLSSLLSLLVKRGTVQGPDGHKHGVNENSGHQLGGCTCTYEFIPGLDFGGKILFFYKPGWLFLINGFCVCGASEDFCVESPRLLARKYVERG